MAKRHKLYLNPSFLGDCINNNIPFYQLTKYTRDRSKYFQTDSTHRERNKYNVLVENWTIYFLKFFYAETFNLFSRFAARRKLNRGKKRFIYWNHLVALSCLLLIDKRY